MNWTDIRKILRDTPHQTLLEIIKGLYNLSPQNKAFIRTQISPMQPDTELLEKSRKQVIRAIYPDNVNWETVHKNRTCCQRDWLGLQRQRQRDDF